MADNPVFLNIVTPPESPRPKEDVPASEPVPPSEAVAPVGEGGPAVEEAGPVAGGVPAVPGSVKVVVHCAVSDDWHSKNTSDLNTETWYRLCVDKKLLEEKIFEITIRKPKKGQGLPFLFPKVKAAVTPDDVTDLHVLALNAHSAPAGNSTTKKENPSQQLLSFGEVGKMAYKPFEEVAKVIKQSVKSGAKYDLILLGCCQGIFLQELLMTAVSKTGVIAYFGDKGEADDDGVAAFLAQDLVEKSLEVISDMVKEDPTQDLEAVNIMKKVYVTLGEDYIGPDQDRLKKDSLGEFVYSKFVLDKSVNEAMKAPDFVEGFTYAGNLHLATAEGDLVTPELKEERANYLRAREVQINAQAAAGGQASSGKRRRS
jgi:hypothetical protein